jgi:4-hydroxymandelate oxidase
VVEERLPVSVDEYEERAREVLPAMVFDYYAGGAGDERTLRGNRTAFDRWSIRPRVLVDVSARDLSTTVVGQPVSFPVLIAPTAFQRLANSEGEVATARAAARAGTVMCLSTIASSTIEEVAEAAPDGVQWFQLYAHKDRGVSEDHVRRAEAAGYRAIVLTVDAPLFGSRDRDARNRFSLPPGVHMANLERDLPQVPGSGLFAHAVNRHDQTIGWDVVEWLRSLTRLPILLKGILTAEDARLAAGTGVEGIIVSNHGGRQLDGVMASIDALPEVLEAAEGRTEVFIDGGFRRGTHVLIALALGARAVLVGRPILWGLAVGGEDGVAHVLDLLRDELDVALTLAGCPRVGDLSPALVAPGS